MTTKCQPNVNQSSTIKIHDWDEWQTFRKDRGAPPWIKIHRNLMTNEKWAFLTDAEKGQLISMWIAGADNEGKLPSDARVIKKICQLDDKPDLDKFSKLGLIDGHDSQVVVNMTPIGCQYDAPEESRVEERREEKSKHPLVEKSTDFDALWKVYSKLNGNKKAYSLSCFNKRKKKKTPLMPDVEALIDIIHQQIKYKAFLTGNNKFCPEWPDLSSWINKDRWTDEVCTGEKVTLKATPEDERHIEKVKEYKKLGYVAVGVNRWMNKEGEIVQE